MAMGLLSFFIIFFYVIYLKKLTSQQSKHQKELLESAIQIQENERRRFAEDLHDDIAATLSIIKMKLTQTSAAAVSEKEEVKTMLEEAIQSTRKISWSLSPVILEKYGLERALQQYVERASRPGLKTNFQHFGNTEKLPSKIEISLYRIAQEMIHNSIKHGGASEIEIILKKLPGSTEMAFRDNGKPFNIKGAKFTTQKIGGLGVKNIQSRLSIIGGAIDYKKVGSFNETVFKAKIN
jgi:signal transduction histidine kinase